MTEYIEERIEVRITEEDLRRLKDKGKNGAALVEIEDGSPLELFDNRATLVIQRHVRHSYLDPGLRSLEGFPPTVEILPDVEE